MDKNSVCEITYVLEFELEFESVFGMINEWKY